jgi:hypothetical protein
MSNQSLLLVNILHFHYLFGQKQGLSRQKNFLHVKTKKQKFLSARCAYARVFLLVANRIVWNKVHIVW